MTWLLAFLAIAATIAYLKAERERGEQRVATETWIGKFNRSEAELRAASERASEWRRAAADEFAQNAELQKELAKFTGDLLILMRTTTMVVKAPGKPAADEPIEHPPTVGESDKRAMERRTLKEPLTRIPGDREPVAAAPPRAPRD